ncbi:MAG: hypothetical protein ABIR36_06205 [Nitrospiraceae bacterium]
MSRGGQNHGVAGLIILCTLGLVSLGHAQMGGGMGGGMGSVPGTAYGGATDPSSLQLGEGFRIIPSVTVGERYDSNVFFAPKTPGLKRDDVVTTVAPQVRGLYAGDLYTVNATIGAIGEYYAQNSGLNYVGTNAGIFLDMSRLASRLREGTRLTVSDTYMYTPQPPAFLTGNLEGTGAHPFFTGIQAARVNMQSNTYNANISTPLNRVVNLTGSYASGFIKFGESKTAQRGTLLNMTYQTYTAGLSAATSAQDTLSLNFISSEFDSGFQGSFTTRGGVAGWSHIFSPTVTLTSNAGVSLIDGTVAGGQSTTAATSAVAPKGNLALLWKDMTTAVTFTYSVGITPTFIGESQTVLSHVVSFVLTQQMGSPQLLGTAGLNYGHGSQFGSSSTPGSAFSFTTYGGVGGVTYKFTPKTFLSLTYGYSNFDQGFGVQGYRFDRHVAQMSITQAFY